jgi:hypothetical protein
MVVVLVVEVMMTERATNMTIGWTSLNRDGKRRGKNKSGNPTGSHNDVVS